MCVLLGVEVHLDGAEVKIAAIEEIEGLLAASGVVRGSALEGGRTRQSFSALSAVGSAAIRPAFLPIAIRLACFGWFAFQAVGASRVVTTQLGFLVTVIHSAVVAVIASICGRRNTCALHEPFYSIAEDSVTASHFQRNIQVDDFLSGYFHRESVEVPANLIVSVETRGE